MSGHRVGIVDYQAGNVHSIQSAFEYLGARVTHVRSASDLEGLTHILLPGVGAFAHCAEKLTASGLVPALSDEVHQRGVPMLGICVGMQLLADFGEELGGHDGLGWVGGSVKALVPQPGVRVPHVGWNEVTFEEAFGDFGNGEQADFYFDHSFAYHGPRYGTVVGSCHHGEAFAAVVRKDNLVAAQFHPEKSQKSGLRFLSGFLKLQRAC